jgi:indolepyruvate ferredoxin oxidoreductase, beta subunit
LTDLNTDSTGHAKPITIAILAMGGEGGGVLSDWLVDLAEHRGYQAQATSVPGVAQRTGSTIYYVELFPEGDAQRDAVLLLMPLPGEVDVVISSELMEAGRAIQRGLVTPDRTMLISSSNRVYSMEERMSMGDGRADSAAILETCGQAAKRFLQADFAKIAEAERSVISAALFGGLAASGSLPFERSDFEEAIRRGGVGVDASLATFAAGYDAVQQGDVQQGEVPAAEKLAAVPKTGPLLATLRSRVESEFPAEAHDILIEGLKRLADYQDEAYAKQFLDRLAPINAADHRQFTLLRETARYLALWMSYEDAIRVADLKIRRTRFDRVREEVRLDSTQVLHINEFLHPGVQEIADIAPAGIGRFFLRSKWAGSVVKWFTGDGRIVRTTSLSGYLQLYFLASLRPLRPRSLRFVEEQPKIDTWLKDIPSLAGQDYALAIEFAECPRVLKGYGETYALGLRNFNAIMAAIPRLKGVPNAAVRLKELREAALADERGQKLSEALEEVLA